MTHDTAPGGTSPHDGDDPTGNGWEVPRPDAFVRFQPQETPGEPGRTCDVASGFSSALDDVIRERLRVGWGADLPVLLGPVSVGIDPAQSDKEFERNVVAIRVEVPVYRRTDAEREAYVAEQRARAAAAWDRHDSLLEVMETHESDPALRAVLALHKPVEQSVVSGPVCLGCDGEGMERESPDWPCRTITTWAEARGHEVPDPGSLYKTWDPESGEYVR